MAQPTVSTTSPLADRRGALGDRLLAQLDRQERKVVVLPEDWPFVEGSIGGGRETSQGVLERLEASGWLRRVRRGTYVVLDRSATTRPGALELVGHVSREPYFVTAGRALAEFGLSDQAFRRIVVVSSHEQRPWTWRKERVRYALVPSERIWGATRRNVSQSWVWIAKPERAILDSLATPRWGVSISQLVEALDRQLVRNPEFAATLARATKRYGRISVARRLGFLVSKLAGEEAASAFLPLVGNDRKPTDLRPRAGSGGAVDAVWKVRVNVPVELLLDHRHGG